MAANIVRSSCGPVFGVGDACGARGVRGAPYRADALAVASASASTVEAAPAALAARHGRSLQIAQNLIIIRFGHFNQRGDPLAF